MDDEKVKKIETLLSMFDARDAMWGKHTRQIGALIQPTVLEALYDLFDVPTDSVEWMDLQIVETVLVVICNITYDPATTTSVFLQRVDQVKQPETPIQVQRLLRIGVPLAIAFSSKEEIKEFLTRIPVESTDDDTDEGAPTVSEDLPEYEGADPELPSPASQNKGASVLGFDTSDLSEDQINRLMLYHHAVEATKQ